MTPLLAMLVLGEGRHRARSPQFVGGLILAVFGANADDRRRGQRGLVPWLGPRSRAVGASQRRRVLHPVRAGGPASPVQRPRGPVHARRRVRLPAPRRDSPRRLAGSPPDRAGSHRSDDQRSRPHLVLHRAGALLPGRRAVRIVLPALFQVMIPIFALLLSAVLLHKIPAPLGLLGIPIAVVGGVFAYRGAPDARAADQAGGRAPDRGRHAGPGRARATRPRAPRAVLTEL